MSQQLNDDPFASFLLEARQELDELKRDIAENDQIIKTNKELDEEIANFKVDRVPYAEMDAETKLKHFKAVFGDQAAEEFHKCLVQVEESSSKVESLAENINKSFEPSEMRDDVQ